MDVVIVDDEPLARQRLQRLVSDLGHEIPAIAASPEEALAAVDKHDPMVVLLDIEMPGGSGLDVAKQIAQLEQPPAIIFTTAYEQYALDAFDTLAAGYLLKPIKREQLAQALEKAQTINKAQLQALNDGHKDTESTASTPKHITVRSHRGVDLIAIDNIRCFLADSKYITVVTTEGEYLMDGTLKQLEAEFSANFMRIHRNAMVSIGHITGLDRAPEGHYCVRLREVEQQPVVSRRYASKVKAMLERL